MFSNQPAGPWNTETSVNLIVNGKVVRGATGDDSEALDWASWDLSDLQGQQAQIQLVDNNTGGWGHVLADQFLLSDTASRSSTERAHWLDYGKDDYAAVSYNDAPGDRRIMIGWMNNWSYGTSIPTSPWRSAMTVPRELTLGTVRGQLRLRQSPVRQLRELHTGPMLDRHQVSIPEGTTALRVHGKALDITATLRLGSAVRSGLKVRTGKGQETVIGYDRKASEVYVDRTRSGDVSFSPDFPGVQRAPLTARRGVVRLHVLVDWSSVVVFADDGRVLLTDQIFPDPSSEGLALFASGGAAEVTSMTVHRMASAWRTGS